MPNPGARLRRQAQEQVVEEEQEEKAEASEGESDSNSSSASSESSGESDEKEAEEGEEDANFELFQPAGNNEVNYLLENNILNNADEELAGEEGAEQGENDEAENAEQQSDEEQGDEDELQVEAAEFPGEGDDVEVEDAALEQEEGGGERHLQPFVMQVISHSDNRQEPYFAQDLQDRMIFIRREEINIALAGILEKLELFNFMCHANLVLEFNRHINFIVGKNGSGKSAIMAAIMIALGTKAADTSRGRNLAAFIKLGASQAKVRLTMSNMGINAYRPDKYGDHIILTRVIQKNSSKMYLQVIKEELNEKGEQVLVTREEIVTRQELENVLCSLKIRLPNCFALMAQDTMKTFWQMMEGEQMYDLLKEGTGIEEAIKIHHNLKDTLKSIDDAQITLEKEYEELQQKEQDLREKYKTVQKMQGAEEKLIKLRNEHIWSEVAVKEANLRTAIVEMTNYYNEKTQKENQLSQIASTLETLRNSFSETEKEIELIETEVERIRKEKADLQKNRESSRKEVEQKNNEVKKSERQLQLARAELDALNQQLTKISKGSQQDELARLESRKKHFEDQKLALENLLKKKETLDTKVTSLKKQLQAKKTEKHNANSSLAQLKTAHAQKEQSHKMSRRKAGTLPAIYGQNIMDLQKALEKLFKQGKLSKMPIGPIGTHIRVKDPKWELAVEIILKSEFKCFYVNSDEDRKLVSTLANKILGNSSLSIVTSQFISEVFNVASNKVKSVPNDGLFNLMDMLIVDKPEVMNYLIDQKGIESILLCEDLNRAFDLMSNVKTVPKNCTLMITPEGEQIHPAPLYRYYSAEASAKVQFLIRNSEHDLQSEAKEIEKSAAQVASEEKEVEALNKEVQVLEKQLKATRSELTVLEAEELNLRKQIEANRLEELDTSQSAFAKVKEDCLETQAAVEEKEKHVKQLMEELATAKEEDKSVEKQISELMSHLRDVQNKKKQIEVKKTEIDNDIISENARESCLLKSLETLEEKETFILQTVDALEKRVAKANELGRTVCEKIQTTRCPQDICKEIEELNSFIKAIGARISDPKMVSQQIQECEEAQVTLRQQIVRIKMAHEELSNAMLQRRSLYNLKIQMIFLQIADLFRLYFVNQSFEGNIQFTHSKRLMTLSLNWRHPPYKTLTNPSGGERTFSIIALILAVWERMRFPFYILDEFDVYMDMVNRHHCTDMLVQMARSRRRYQYIFLTPQDSNLKSEEDLTIHQLADPRPNGVSLA